MLTNSRLLNILQRVLKAAFLSAMLVLFIPGTASAHNSLPVTKDIAVIKTNPLLEARKGLQGDLSLLLGYDSNVSYGAGDNTSAYEETVPGLSVYFSPSIKWVSQDLHKRLNADSRFNYGAELRVNAHGLYATNSIYNDVRFGINANAVMYYNAGKHFKLQLFEMLNRYSDPHYLFKDTFSQNWYSNKTGVGMFIVPGDGLLDMVFRYTLDLTFFEDSDVSEGNRLGHNFDFRTSYSFLPKSTLWFASTFKMYSYMDSNNRDSMPLKLYAGISTPLVLNFGITLGGGYGWGFYSAGSSPQTWLATASVYYTIINKLKLSLKYAHAFNDSIIGSYADSHDISFMTYIPLGRKLYIAGEIGTSFMTTYDIVYTNGATGPPTRSDVVLFATLKSQYRLRKNLLIGAQYKLSMDQTDYRMTTGTHPPTNPPTDPTISNNPSFIKHQIYFTLSYIY